MVLAFLKKSKSFAWSIAHIIMMVCVFSRNEIFFEKFLKNLKKSKTDRFFQSPINQSGKKRQKREAYLYNRKGIRIMNQTSGDSKREVLEICCSELQHVIHEKDKKYSKYAIFNGEDKNARVEISIGPGMEIEVKDGITTTPEKMMQILENKGSIKTEKQLKKQKDNIRE